MEQKILITDLDGSLLDPETYGYEAAKPGLELLAARRIPVIFCTSKTRAEVEHLRQEVGNQDPFIVENGGAIYIPHGYFPRLPVPARSREGYDVVECGVPYAQLRENLRTIAQSLGVSIKGFGDMTPEELAQMTGLSPAQAVLAQQREYDEPFLVIDQDKLDDMCREAERRGLTVILAGRFAHLVGKAHHKGTACRILLACYRQQGERCLAAAIGDSVNDFPMLEQVEYPFLVEQRGGGYPAETTVKGLVYVKGVGPQGWVRAVRQFLEEP
ncbi:MAG: HAD-IIB family hydrolase [Nitrospirae bacterium]|nr:MAG: HAD-IIB family hydrolase [Nitrospirota bacterium]